MRRLLPLALLLVTFAAEAQVRPPGSTGGIRTNPGSNYRRPTGSYSMWLPLTQSGAGFDCTGALSCITWNGSALVDAGGLTWTQNGTVPQVASTSLPTTASTGAAGPFSDANYYSYPTASDPLDSTGDRWGCVGFVPVDTSGQVLFQNGGASATAGHFVAVTTTTGTFYFRSMNPTAVSATTANGATTGGFNVACWWRTGTSISAKLNLGTTATNAAAGTEVAGTAYTAKIGRYESSGTAFTGTILSVIQGLGACPTPPAPFAASCEGWATYQMKRQFGLIGTRGEEISLTRATTATNEVNGTVWNVPAAVPRITTQGLLVERAATNSALQSSTLSTGTAATSPWTLNLATVSTTSAGCGIDGSACAEVTSSTVVGSIFQTVTTASSTTFSARSRVVRASGSAIATVSLRCGGVPTTCTCFPAASCTASTGGGSANDCTAKAPVAQTGFDLGVSVTCPAAITNPVFILYPGEVSVSAGTARFTMAQVETGLTPTSYIPTAGTSVARNADSVNVATTVMGTLNPFCMEVTATPYGGRAWTTTPAKSIFSTFNGSFLNTVSLREGYLGGGATGSLLGNPATGQSAIVTGALSAGTHRLSVSGSFAGVPTVRVDGATPAFTTSGAPGSISAWSSSRVGLGSGGAAAEFDGYLRDFKVYRSPSCR